MRIVGYIKIIVNRDESEIRHILKYCEDRDDYDQNRSKFETVESVSEPFWFLGFNSIWWFLIHNCFNNEYTSREKVEECYSNSCETSWGYYCKEDDVYRNRTCYDKGCEDAECYVNPYEQEELYEDCADTCVDGKCRNVECYYDSDCGENGWMNMEFCWCGKLFDYYVDYTCEYAGTSESYCSSSVQLLIKGDCENPFIEAASMNSEC